MTVSSPPSHENPPRSPFSKGGKDYPSLSQREVGRDLRKLFSTSFKFRISNFGHWNLVIRYYLGFGIWLLEFFSTLVHLNFGFLAARTSSSLLTLTL